MNGQSPDDLPADGLPNISMNDQNFEEAIC